MNLIGYIDGSSHGNPGDAGYGVVLKDENGRILLSKGFYIGFATNNVAEYRGLLGCINLAQQFKASQITVYSDSELLVKQMTGKYRVKKEHLKLLFQEACELIHSKLDRFEILYIPREKNMEADGLARRAVRLRTDIHI
jgi:ribonuclease HI